MNDMQDILLILSEIVESFERLEVDEDGNMIIVNRGFHFMSHKNEDGSFTLTIKEKKL